MSRFQIRQRDGSLSENPIVRELVSGGHLPRVTFHVWDTVTDRAVSFGAYYDLVRAEARVLREEEKRSLTNRGEPMWHDSEDRDRGAEPDYYLNRDE